MRMLPLVACLTVLVTGTAVAQEAYVYDYVPNKGVYVYDASSVGKLTAISGSPFKVTGVMVGTNGKYFVSADGTYLYSYKIASNGAVGAKVSDIDTQKYGGAECGPVDTTASGGFPGSVTAEFGHTGENLSVLLTGAEGSEGGGACDGMQTYGVSSKGMFTFKGVAEVNKDATDFFNAYLPTLTGNGKFGYGFDEYIESDLPCNGTSLLSYRVEPSGALNYLSGEPGSSSASPVTFPAVPPGFPYWELLAKTDDTTDHIVLAIYSTTDNDCEDDDIDQTPVQLGSFTADSQGNLTTTCRSCLLALARI